jgi:hypothetical protein
VRASIFSGRNFSVTALASAALVCSVQAAFSVNCEPRHYRAPYFIKDMGACNFDPDTLSFAGTPAEQAMCLMRGMDETRNLAPPLNTLPAALTDRVGQITGLPSRDALSAYLSSQNLEWDFAAHLWQPDSHARDNDPDAPAVRYFVIHDTSGPNFHHRSFPDDIDSTAHFNSLSNFVCADGWGKAHVVLNRAGKMLLDHEFSIPWRETKFEQAANFNGALKGLFIHIEMIQPRRSGSHGGDSGSPNPAFSQAQYDRLALLYTIASVRAGRWLIPAFHAALDSDIRNGHDDPLNFDISSFAASIDRMSETLAHASLATAPHDVPASDKAIPYAVTAIDDPPPPVEASASSPADSTEPKSAEPKPGVLLDTANGASKPAPGNASGDAKVAAKEGESRNEQKAADAGHCEAHGAKGNSGQLCEPDRSASSTDGRSVRSVDRDVPHEGRRARHRGRYVHARHGRDRA